MKSVQTIFFIEILLRKCLVIFMCFCLYFAYNFLYCIESGVIFESFSKILLLATIAIT